MKQKHYTCIIAWAEGKDIQWRDGGEWHNLHSPPMWHDCTEYRVKPEPKKDFYTYLTVTHSHTGNQTLCKHGTDNVKFTYDGETKQLKFVEII